MLHVVDPGGFDARVGPDGHQGATVETVPVRAESLKAVERGQVTGWVREVGQLLVAAVRLGEAAQCVGITGDNRARYTAAKQQSLCPFDALRVVI